MTTPETFWNPILDVFDPGETLIGERSHLRRDARASQSRRGVSPGVRGTEGPRRAAARPRRPEGGVDLLIRGLEKKMLYLGVGPDLNTCRFGSIALAWIRKGLGELFFQELLSTLLEKVEENRDRAKLHWIVAVAAQPPAIESMLELLDSKTPSCIRLLAATHLLKSPHRRTTIKTLQELSASEPSEAAEAVQALAREDEAALLDWGLLIDTALGESRNRAVVHLTHAVTLWQLDETDKALDALDEALFLEPFVTDEQDLRFDHFWREKALAAVREMLDFREANPREGLHPVLPGRVRVDKPDREAES